jgi:hypothetical protein
MNSRTWPPVGWVLPLVHAGVALVLLSNLYLTHWSEWRHRDTAEQKWVEEEARAGHWPPAGSVGFEPDYFGAPRQIAVLFAPDLPALLLGAPLVVPSPARDHLLERAPGRMLPSTRTLIFILLFTGFVAAQWYAITVIARRAFSLLLRRILYFGPILYIPVGLVVPDRIEISLRFAAVILWVVFGGWAIWRVCIYCRQKARAVRRVSPA